MSYHKLKIHKHSVDSPYKLQEEFLEYIDALATGNKVMAIQELSDLFGCIENEVQKFGMSVDDLKVMSDLTKEVFESGTRVNEGLLEYLKGEHEEIYNYGLGFIQVKCGDINYNFYHEDLPTFETYLAPHSHQRDFVSEVIKGEVCEITFEVTDGSKEAYCSCGNLLANPKMLDYSIKEMSNYKSGDLYLRMKEEYHSVKAEHGTVTMVTKYGDKVNAFVIAPRESEVIAYLTEEECWDMVEEVLDVFN